MAVSWSAGYSTDVAYTVGFYRELAPTLLDYVCVANGVAGLPQRPIRYCELGCGRGYATVLLAAANPDSQFVGIDFNPTHVAEARSYAADTGVDNVTFHEMNFGEAAGSSDPGLGTFDVVAMHGVYSWVLPEVRAQIHDFVRAKLVAGGIFYVSYNTMPGWAAVGPVQRLLQEVASRSTGDSLARFDKGYTLLRGLADKSSAFVSQNPTLKNRIADMEKQDKHYLAHEFLNAGWQPLYVTEAMAMLAEAKLSYVGSANVAENRIALAVPQVHQEAVTAAPDEPMRELLKDYVVNKFFRRDVYIKGPQRLSQREQSERLARMAFVRPHSGTEIPEKFKVPAGDATPKPEMLKQVMAALDEGARTGAELTAAAESGGGSSGDILLLLDILIYHGLVHPARADHAGVDHGPAHRLNHRVLEAAETADTHRCLASPVIGSAIAADRLDRLFAPLVLADPDTSDEALANTALARFKVAGLKLRRDEKTDLPDDDAAALAKLAGGFRASRLPRWRMLGLISQ
jgi:SAM-dependent methyltransferase